MQDDVFSGQGQTRGDKSRSFIGSVNPVAPFGRKELSLNFAEPYILTPLHEAASHFRSAIVNLRVMPWISSGVDTCYSRSTDSLARSPQMMVIQRFAKWINYAQGASRRSVQNSRRSASSILVKGWTSAITWLLYQALAATEACH